jgi:hypothetical protein
LGLVDGEVKLNIPIAEKRVFQSMKNEEKYILYKLSVLFHLLPPKPTSSIDHYVQSKQEFNRGVRRSSFKLRFATKMKKVYGAVPWRYEDGRDPKLLRKFNVLTTPYLFLAIEGN